MIDELNHASFLLDNALDRYFMACSTIQDHYLQSESFGTIPNILSQRVAHEALILSKYELKLQASRARINWARNSSTHLVPINSLPPEVLVRIFQFALGSNNIGNMYRHPRLNRKEVRDTTSSDVLSQVCSYWRQVAFNSSQLWTRIDLSPCQVVNYGLLPRSAAFAERAGGMLLDIYITDPIREWSTSATLDHFIRAVAPRIRSLNLRICQTLRTDAYRNVLSASLLHSAPGTFTTLIATREPDNLASTYIFFDMPDFGVPEHGVGFYQRIFTLANEAVLLSIKVMRLHACYPFWTSKAYYGLVELRLTPRTSDVPISEAHLCGILQASPGLRIFEFALKIVDFLPEGTTIPVQLDCLEALNIRMMNYQLVPNFLRMINPGSCPLQFSLPSAPIGDPRVLFNRPNIPRAFFSHANITLLHANDFNKDEIVGILGLCPHLQTLAWDGYNLSDEPESDALISHPGIRSLLMIYCEVPIDLFSRWINLPSLEKLEFYRCSFYQDNESEIRLGESQIRMELPGISPTINILGYNVPNPTEEWELFDPDS
ncbi:hypothetical protein ACGC1H_002555 [Rhizoctonia solani]|uniref:F-box domain-containing protein n=1 Tax=Rhizoctonia solani TaxID=456999 RepID=A0A8H3BWN4_9AGAM|nr:unnamed protein product [Rhizoctonia solani]